MRTLFIGDLHLSADRQDILDTFYHLLDYELEDVEALYILGDLFEQWIGDDVAEPFTKEVAHHIACASAKLPIYFIHGNRDFLVGNSFAKLAGMTLLPEHHRITLYNQNYLILHGDSLCTLDSSYQRFRRFRNLSWPKTLYALLPRAVKQYVANRIRSKSNQGNQQKSYQVMDVEPTTVENLLLENNAQIMIHGHTHRPNIHHFTIDKNAYTRAVVGDWYSQASLLSVSEDGLQLTSYPLSKNSN